MIINILIAGQQGLQSVATKLGDKLDEDILIDQAGDIQTASQQLEDNSYDVLIIERELADKAGSDILTQMVKAAGQEIIVMIAEDEAISGVYLFDGDKLNYLKYGEMTDLGWNKLIKNTAEKNNICHDLCHNTEIFGLAENLAKTGGWTYDLNTGCLEVTKGFLDIFGISQKTENCLAVHDLKDILKEVDKEYRLYLYSLLRLSYEQEKEIETELGIHIDDKEKWIRLVAVSKKGQSGNENKPTKLMGGVMDISKEKNLQSFLEQKSLYDGLTGLKNRFGFYTFEQESRLLAKRNEQMMFLMYAKLTNLKEVGAYYDQAAVDKLIVDFAEMLKKSYRETDLLATIDRGEFLVLGNMKGPAKKDGLLSRLVKNLDDYNQDAKIEMEFNYGIEIFAPKFVRNLDGVIQKTQKEVHHQKSGANQDDVEAVIAYFRSKS